MKKDRQFRLAAAILCLAIAGAALASCNRSRATGQASEKARIVLASASAEIAAAQASQAVFSGGVFRIVTGGRFVVSGEHEGQILIEATESDTVELVLDGATLYNPNGPAIFAPGSQRVELVLANGTVNNISDGRRPDDNANAAVYVWHDLLVSGSGTLNVNGNHRHGIRARGVLTATGGTINATAPSDTVSGRNGVVVEGGVFELTAGNDGIRTDASVTINGGSVTVTAIGNGINANESVLITGGSVNVIDSYEGIEGLNVTITGGDVSIFARDDGINASDFTEPVGGTRGRYGINPNMFVRIAGGNVRVHGLSDGIDSNGNVFLEGGRLLVSGPSGGGRDAIDMDGTFTVTGGELVAVGSIRRVSPQSTQPVLIASLGRQFAAGSIVELRDTAGRTVLEHTGETAFSTLGFTSPAFEPGGAYSIYVDGIRVSNVAITGIVTNAGTGGNRRL